MVLVLIIKANKKDNIVLNKIQALINSNNKVNNIYILKLGF